MGSHPSLPLIGGGVALIGAPSAVAEPVTPDLLGCYKTWLDFEQRWLAWEMAGDPFVQNRYRGFYRGMNDSMRAELAHEIHRHHLYVGDSDSYHSSGRQKPSKRAALVLSTVGCDWREAA